MHIYLYSIAPNRHFQTPFHLVLETVLQLKEHIRVNSGKKASRSLVSGPAGTSTSSKARPLSLHCTVSANYQGDTRSSTVSLTDAASSIHPLNIRASLRVNFSISSRFPGCLQGELIFTYDCNCHPRAVHTQIYLPTQLSPKSQAHMHNCPRTTAHRGCTAAPPTTPPSLHTCPEPSSPAPLQSAPPQVGGSAPTQQ